MLSYLLDKEIKLRDHPFWFNAALLITQLVLSRNEVAGSDPGVVPHVRAASLCILGLARLTLYRSFLDSSRSPNRSFAGHMNNV